LVFVEKDKYIFLSKKKSSKWIKSLLVLAGAEVNEIQLIKLDEWESLSWVRLMKCCKFNWTKFYRVPFGAADGDILQLLYFFIMFFVEFMFYVLFRAKKVNRLICRFVKAAAANVWSTFFKCPFRKTKTTAVLLL
jgi:hypothetical protein